MSDTLTVNEVQSLKDLLSTLSDLLDFWLLVLSVLLTMLDVVSERLSAVIIGDKIHDS